MTIAGFLKRAFGRSKSAEADAVTTVAVPSPQASAPPPVALQLARECVLLKRTGSDLAAIWGEDGVVPPPPGPYRHWISVDCRHLTSAFGEEGVVSIYTNEKDCVSGIAAFSQTAVLTGHQGQPLYAHHASSFPPPDACPELDNTAYLECWMANCPIYEGKDIVAVLGGWHFPWPDGDWEELRGRELLLWTIENAEPYVEVWQSGKDTTVMQRVT